MRYLIPFFVTSLFAVFIGMPTAAQWSKSAANNVELSDGAGLEVQVKLESTSQGFVYASWFDSDPAGSPAFGYDVRLQRFDAAGNAQWAAGGITIADRGFSSTQDYGLSVNDAGDALLAFRDDRVGGIQITVARVDAAGTQLWGSGGVQLTNTTDFLGAPEVAGLPGTDVTLVAWTQAGTVRVRRVNPDGSLLGPEIVLAQAGTTFSLADMKSGGAPGAAVLSWISQTGGFFGPRHLYAQAIDAAGTQLWVPGGEPVETSGSLQVGNFPELVTGPTGAYFSWYTVSPLQSWVRYVNPLGFGYGPVAVSTNTSRIRVSPSLDIDPLNSQATVFWTEQNAAQSQSGLRVQRFDSSGNRLFGAEGLELLALSSDSVQSVQTAALPGAARGSWIGGAGFGNDQVHSILVSDLGGVLLPSTTLATTPSSKDDLATLVGPLGDVLCAWHGDESGDEGVYAQNVGASGVLGPRAGSLTRNAGTNVDSYTATVGGIGGTAQLEVDLTTTGYPFALVLGYSQPAAAPFGTQVVLVNITLGELLNFGLQAGPIAQFNGAIPNDPSLCGFVVYSQGVHLGAGLPFVLTNAVDLYLGVL